MRHKENLAILALLILAACFFGVALRPGKEGAQAAGVKPIALPATALLNGRSDFQGDIHSPYTLIEFGDYECPPCRAQQAKVEQLLSEYPGKLRLDFRNLPLVTLHPHAMYAAIIAEAARKEKNFQTIHALLFKTPMQDENLLEVLHTHLKEGRLSSSLKTEARRAVEADMELASTLRIQGTPGFFLCTPSGEVFPVALSDIPRLME